MTLSPHLKALALKQSFRRGSTTADVIQSEEEKLPDPPAVLSSTGLPYPDTPVELIMRGKNVHGFRFYRRGCGFTIAMDDSYEVRCFTSHKFTPAAGFFQVNMTPEDYKYALKVADFELSADDLASLADRLKILDENWIRDLYDNKQLSIKPLGPQAMCFEFAENGREYTITTYSSSVGRAPSFIMNYHCDKGHETPRKLTVHEQERAINRISAMMTIMQSAQYAENIQSLREHVATAKALLTRPVVKKLTINDITSGSVCFELIDGDVTYTLTAFHPSMGRSPSFVKSCVDRTTGHLLPIPLSISDKNDAISKIVGAMTVDQCIQYTMALDILRQAIYMANDPPPAQDTGRFAPARSINFFG